ncbi:MAG: hypothetical protein Greene041662_202 [Candidatus Peregrinibacteria bacterium Greene0416_62]|nr:MAG: hypothetical protein Greene041662_202 [Candidatus Peregrinibacteria bacterium Greene0416_62]
MCAIVTTSKKRITLISTITGDSDTLIPLAFCVLVATYEGGAFIGICTGDIDALAAITDEMRIAITTTQERIAVILAIARDSDASIIGTFRMLTACNFL